MKLLFTAISMASLMLGFALNTQARTIDALDFLPKGTNEVSAIDMDAVRSSPITKPLIASLKKMTAKRPELNHTPVAIEPLVDSTTHILAAGEGSLSNMSPKDKAMLVVHFSDDSADKIKAKLQEQGKFTKATGPAGEYYAGNGGVALFRKDHIIVTTDAWKDEVFSALSNKDKLDGKVKSLVKQSQKTKGIWAISAGKNTKRFAKLYSALRDVKYYALTMELSDLLTIDLLAHYRSAEMAAHARDKVQKDLDSFANDEMAKQLGLESLFKRIQFTADGATGKMQAHFNKEESDMIAGMLAGMIQSAMQ